jgi:hypothetical protein
MNLEIVRMNAAPKKRERTGQSKGPLQRRRLWDVPGRPCGLRETIVVGRMRLPKHCRAFCQNCVNLHFTLDIRINDA